MAELLEASTGQQLLNVTMAIGDESPVAPTARVSVPRDRARVLLIGFCQVTTAAGMTGLRTRSRKQIGASFLEPVGGDITENLFAAAGSTEPRAFVGIDVLGPEAGITYWLGVSAFGGAGAPTFLRGSLLALVF